MRSYNLFCRPDRADLACAVPEDRPVPAFIRGPPWEFVGRVNESTIDPRSFNHEAAEASVRFNGFYLFQPINAPDLRRKTRQASATVGDPAIGRDTQPRGTVTVHLDETERAPCQVKVTVEVASMAHNVQRNTRSSQEREGPDP